MINHYEVEQMLRERRNDPAFLERLAKEIAKDDDLLEKLDGAIPDPHPRELSVEPEGAAGADRPVERAGKFPPVPAKGDQFTQGDRGKLTHVWEVQSVERPEGYARDVVVMKRVDTAPGHDTAQLSRVIVDTVRFGSGGWQRER